MLIVPPDPVSIEILLPEVPAILAVNPIVLPASLALMPIFKLSPVPILLTILSTTVAWDEPVDTKNTGELFNTSAVLVG